MRYVTNASLAVNSEYTGSTVALENNTLTKKRVPSERELLIFPDTKLPLEAFLAQTSFELTAEILKQRGMRNAFEKTIRFPGHYRAIKSLQELGFFAKEPIVIGQKEIIPFEVAYFLFEKNIPEAKEDFLILYIRFEKTEGCLALFLCRNTAEMVLTAMQRNHLCACGCHRASSCREKAPGRSVSTEEVIDFEILTTALQEMGLKIEVQRFEKNQ